MGDHDDIITEDSFPEETAEGSQPASAPVVLDGKTVWRVKVLYSSATEFCEAPAGVEAKIGDMVVVPTRYGNELGRILGRETDPAEVTSELRTIQRLASPADLLRVEENDTREERAFEVCREKIESRNLSNEARERALHP